MERYPMPGDAVRLTAPWSSAKPGDFGIIGGMVGEVRDIVDVTFGCRCTSFRGRPSGCACDVGRPEVVSCSGGPGSFSFPASLLKPTDKTIVWTFWCWRRLPCAGGAVKYDLEVPVWDWDGRMVEDVA